MLELWTSDEKLFERELRKCKVKAIIFEHYNDITKERECKDYKESKHKIKYEEIAESLIKAYSIRNKIVHGSESRIEPKLMSKVAGYLRESIKKLL